MKKSEISSKAFVMAGVQIMGDVQVAECASLWLNAVLRGDSGTIVIGENSNIQDGSVVHSEGGRTVAVGRGVTVGHACIIHGCRLGTNTLVGMGSIIMDDVDIGENCIIGAGSLVTRGTVIPDGSLALGRPATVVRPLRQEEIQKNKDSAEHYVQLARQAKENA